LILLDTSGLFAAANETQPEHESARRVLESAPGPFFLSPFVLAELDYLVAARAGVEAELALLDEVAAGTYELVPFAREDVAEARRIIEAYRDLGIGLADASIVVLASKLGTDRILTLDERHFRALRSPRGGPFTLLPADA
jgi:predicted nucleic acid-binding protein